MNCCENKNITNKNYEMYVLIAELFMIINMLMKYLLEIII